MLFAGSLRMSFHAYVFNIDHKPIIVLSKEGEGKERIE